MKNLKQNLNEYYQDKELTTAQLDRLQSKRSISFLYPVGGTIAACLIIFFIVFTPGLQHTVMKEIVYNHNKNLPSEIKTSNLFEIQQHLSKLDFTIAQSDNLPKEIWQVLGARYCSIQGKVAAQIKIKNLKTGQIHTLYQAKSFDQKISSESDLYGAHVKVWTEKGLIMGLAGPQSLMTKDYPL